MTRRLKARIIAIGCVVFGIILGSVHIWLVVEKLRFSSLLDEWLRQDLLIVGWAALAIIPAWGFWCDRWWGYVAAFVWPWLLVPILGLPAILAPVLMSAYLQLLLRDDTDPRVIASWAAASQDVDRVATAVGFRWDESPLPRIAELVRTGQRDAAAKLYREAFGVSWDAALTAVAIWESNEVERKLRLLARHLEQTSAVAPVEVPT